MFNDPEKDKYIDKSFEAVAVPLESIGINDVAWFKNDSIEIINSLSNSNVAILGGDVLKEEDGNFDLTNDNWFSEPKNGETGNNFAERSRKETLTYIKNYPENDNSKYVYTLVVKYCP